MCIEIRANFNQKFIVRIFLGSAESSFQQAFLDYVIWLSCRYGNLTKKLKPETVVTLLQKSVIFTKANNEFAMIIIVENAWYNLPHRFLFFDWDCVGRDSRSSQTDYVEAVNNEIRIFTRNLHAWQFVD